MWAIAITFCPSSVVHPGLNTKNQLVLQWAQFTKIYPPLPTSVQPISITKTLHVVIVPTLKFYQQLTGEERRIPFIFDDFHFCRSRVIWLDRTENRIFTLWPPAPHICPTYFHNQNITCSDCSDQKWKGPSSLHRYAADKISKHSEKHYSSYHTT
jgi:hypothetical protein